MNKFDGPRLVIALFSFKGKNNDELCFKKGDVITITQLENGGWWEGTLHEKTGWFPSNYVKEYKPSENNAKLSPEKNAPEISAHQIFNRDIVLKNMIDSEKANVAELQNLITTFLQPLENSNILKKEEYKQLIGNMNEILETHQRLLTSLENPEAKVGSVLLAFAPRIKSIHTNYCNGHPQAVCILDRYRDELNEFMENQGVVSPGILCLTTGLSKPFRRLEKYSAMLQELERHTEKNHPDRGDTQRSVSVYREISEQCAAIRKQRELALHILTSGIKGWEGEELSALGNIIHVGPVTLVMGNERCDRYFCLFNTTLLMLSTSPRMSSFVYEGKLPLTGINVTPLEEPKYSFEITGPMIENITVICAVKDDFQLYLELLGSQTPCPTRPQPLQVSSSCPPYKRLSRLYARLVRRKIITPELVKKLLYLPYSLRPDLGHVRMRKWKLSYAVVLDSRSSTESTPEPRNRDPTSTRFISWAPQEDLFQERLSFEASKSLPTTMLHQEPATNLTSAQGKKLSRMDQIEDSTRSDGKSPRELWLRSQDSGIPESCCFAKCESDVDENKFENQCICASPFGSTPCESEVSLDLGKHGSLGRKSEEPEKRMTVPMVASGKGRRRGRKIKAEEERPRVYTSGLYVHWWLKKPISVLGDNQVHGCPRLSMELHGPRDREGTDSTGSRAVSPRQSSGKQGAGAMEAGASPGIKSPWSLASLRPAPPIYKNFARTDTPETSRSPRMCNERQFIDDAMILKVIEGYCLTVNARFTVHSAMLDCDPLPKIRDRVSLTNSKAGNWDSMEIRCLSETVKILKGQMLDLQNQVAQLTQQMDEERKSRSSLAASVKRSIAIIDNSPS